MSSRRSEVVYEDRRTDSSDRGGRRRDERIEEVEREREKVSPRRRRVQEISYEELEDVRNREMALVTRPRSPSRERSDRLDVPRERSYENDRDEDDNYYAVRRVMTRAPRPLAERRSHDLTRYRDPPRSRSRSSSSSSSRHRHHRRHRSHSHRPAEKVVDEDTGSVLWYSSRPRREGNFFEKNFDSSYDGLIAGGAGAAIGSITAARFVTPKHEGMEGEKRERTRNAVLGAVVGAGWFNAGENWFRVYTEEKEERIEKREKREELRERR
nr:hypothetical protein B0A51_06045 [Rachicladosporium sp. CCFEE 5018]